MFGSIKGRLIGSMAAALLFFAAGSGATIFALYSETSRFEMLNRDAAATARERLPLLTTLERLKRNIGEVQAGVLESIAQHHAVEPGADIGDQRAEEFWTDTETARQHAANLGLSEVTEAIDAMEMIFPLFYSAGLEIARAYADGSRDTLDNEVMRGFSDLGNILDGSVDELPTIVEQITQERLKANDLRAVTINRNNRILLRVIVATTVVGGFLALAASLYLFRLLATQYQVLKTERDRAEVAARSKTEFLLNMGHELRTPLNAIIGFSEIMEKETLGPVGNLKYLGYATDIRESGQQLLSLIDDILDLSRIDSGKTELQEDVVDVAPVIRATLAGLGPEAEQRGIKTSNWAWRTICRR